MIATDLPQCPQVKGSWRGRKTIFEEIEEIEEYEEIEDY